MLMIANTIYKCTIITLPTIRYYYYYYMDRIVAIIVVIQWSLHYLSLMNFSNRRVNPAPSMTSISGLAAAASRSASVLYP